VLAAEQPTMKARAILSGQRDDLAASALRGVLGGLSVPYRMVILRRNRRYDRAVVPIHRCAVPVISVGNLTTGGTGKTPVVCHLAAQLHKQNKQVVVISRGYGSAAGEPNDEALELADRLPDVPHVQHPDRVAAATTAIENHAADVILMDDGFQHRRLHRDLDIVAIDATCPFGYGHLLPRGLLREPIESLSRAGLVIITRCDTASEAELVEIEQTIRAVHPSVPILRSVHRPTSLLTVGGETQPIGTWPVAALSAIGNPAAFEASLRNCGMEVVAAKQLPDHDRYNAQRIDQIKQWVSGLGDEINAVICTHKDLVKLRRMEISGKPLHALLIELTFLDETSPLDRCLHKVVGDAATDRSGGC